MGRRLQASLILAVALLAGLAGYFFSRPGSHPAVAEGAGQRLMSLPLSDLSGKPQTLSQWSGNILVVNFWATWCAPCREEIPALIRIQKQYESKGVKVVGIALDNASKVRDYAEEMHVDYALFVAGMEAFSLLRDLGNGAGVLPFSVVRDRSGKLIYTHAGVLTEATLGAKLAELR